MAAFEPARIISRLRIGRVFHRAAHTGGPVRRRWIAGAATGVGLVLAAGMLVLAVPVPFVDALLAGQIADRVRGQVACPGSLAVEPAVKVGGGRLLPQVLRQRLAEVQLTVPDATLSGVPHAAFSATMRDVSQPDENSTHVGSIEAAITVGFANMPSADGAPVPTYQRAEDGGLTVSVLSPRENSKNVKAKLFLKMQIQGATVRSVPQRLEIFGQSLPAAEVSDLTGGVRSQSLPDLPDGVSYRSITPRRDGLHVAIAGVSTTALNTLPPQVGDRDVTYVAEDGLLGISTSVGIEPIINVPLTIFTAPRLNGGSLTLEPQTVRILGADRRTTDPLARLVLSQIDQESLTRTLPALPAGVRYRSVSVGDDGIKLVISGVTTRPFSALTQPKDRPTVYSAEDGLLTATVTGSPEDTPIVLHAKPRITGTTLDIAPEQIEMFGTRFPAGNVLAEVKAQETSYDLQPLPPNLTYQSVAVLPEGLLIRLAGRDVTLTKGALTGATEC
jgi:hypothetical protein